MKYLGSITGTGVLMSNGVELAEAAYELEGYVRQKGHVTGSGEIGLELAVAKRARARNDLQLRTADGQVLDLAISDTKMRTPDRILVDIAGDLPAYGVWSL